MGQWVILSAQPLCLIRAAPTMLYYMVPDQLLWNNPLPEAL